MTTTLTTSPPPRTGPVGPARPTSARLRTIRHALVLAKRNIVKTTRTPEQFIDVTLQPIIFLVLFTYVFGGAISHGSRHDYLQFLLPGLLGQQVALGSVALGQNLNADIEKGIFDRFRSLPIARSAPLVGAVLADVFRYLTLCAIFIGFGYVIGFRVTTNPWSAIAALVLTVAFALCFCWVSVWVGMLVRSPGAVQGVMFLLILPLSFGSNTFVAASTMPGWLQAFVKVNPISHLVGAVRGLMLGGPVEHDLLATLGCMAGMLAVFVPLALHAYRRRA